MPTASPASPSSASYCEIRHHELRKSRMQMVDGNLVSNTRSVEAGASARVYDGGYWGFAATPHTDVAHADAAVEQAMRNARAMGRFGVRAPLALPAATYRGEHAYRGREPLTPRQCADRLAELHAWCAARYPQLTSTRFLIGDEHHTKRVSTSHGSDVLSSIQRAFCYVVLVAEDERGVPVELMHPVSAKGHLGDLDWSLERLAPLIDDLHGHVQAKRHAVPARGGLHTVVLAPDLAGMLAHEAMGHPCEADIVLGGAVTGDLVGQRVASELVSMVDYAHTIDGEEALIPVYADDEGTPARDAVLIRDGVLTDFMHSRETSARMGLAPTGSARAYGTGDEPLVRMRNTAIRPGRDTLADMIAGVEEGYLLMKTSNGQADTTTEFMFGVNLAYEIRGGQRGRAVRDTTLSGSAIKVLQTVDAVSDDMSWNCSGYCGKKQPMVVSMGGPALRARAHLGGE